MTEPSPNSILPESCPEFQGFPDFRSNVTYTPIQAFTVVLPNSSRGCARIVLYMIRRILGWVDEEGNPVEEQLQFSLSDLSKGANVSRRATMDALKEAIEKRYVNCLQEPRAKTVGDSGCSGVYELRWDYQNFTNDSEEFDGFYYQQSYIGKGGKPWSSRKNVPNDFFDIVVKEESLATIRLVGCLLFYSIAWGAGGERKTKVQKSHRELSRLTNLGRTSIKSALSTSLQKNYVVQVEKGRFDLSSNQDNSTSVYGISWAKSSKEQTLTSVQKVTTESDRCKMYPREPRNIGAKSTHGTVQNLTTDRCKKNRPIGAKSDHEIGAKSDHVKEIKLKRNKTTERYGENAVAVSLLIKEGFDEGASKFLANNYSLELIKNQIEALPRRNPNGNPLGLLRKSIEDNWSIPEKRQTSDASPTSVFCSAFYAGFNGNSGSLVAKPSQTDLEASEKLVQSFGAKTNFEKLGRRFGTFSKTRSPEARSCAQAVRSSGDAFLVSLRTKTKKSQPVVDKQEEKKSLYRTYLGQAETKVKKNNPELYRKFISYRMEKAEKNPLLKNGSEQMREAFNSDSWRIEDFANFISTNQVAEVLDFNMWAKSEGAV